MKNESEIMRDEWLRYANDDLESAKIILEKTDHYYISVYHSHQAIEKSFKWFLLKNNKKFPFIHDIKELFKMAAEIKKTGILLEDVLFVDNLFPLLRYPTGEKISKEDAIESVKIAEKILKILTQ